MSILRKKKINVQTYRYKLELNIKSLKILPPVIHENNGTIKLMFRMEARLRNIVICQMYM